VSYRDSGKIFRRLAMVFRCFFATLPKIYWLTPPWILCYNGPNEVFSGFHSDSLWLEPRMTSAMDWIIPEPRTPASPPGIHHRNGRVLVADRPWIGYNPSILIRNTNEIHPRHSFRSSLCGSRFWSCYCYGSL